LFAMVQQTSLELYASRSTAGRQVSASAGARNKNRRATGSEMRWSAGGMVEVARVERVVRFVEGVAEYSR